MSIDFWSMSCGLAVIGILCAIAAEVMRQIAKRKECYHGYAEARVVAFITEPRNDTYVFSQFHNRQAAVFEFIVDGKLIKGTDPSEVYPSPYRINQKVKVLYDPKDPQKFCAAAQNSWRLAASAMKLAAVALIVFAVFCFLMYAARIEL